MWAFDLLIADGVDQGDAGAKREEAQGWIPLTNGVVGEGRALYRANQSPHTALNITR